MNQLKDVPLGRVIAIQRDGKTEYVKPVSAGEGSDWDNVVHRDGYNESRHLCSMCVFSSNCSEVVRNGIVLKEKNSTDCYMIACAGDERDDSEDVIFVDAEVDEAELYVAFEDIAFYHGPIGSEFEISLEHKHNWEDHHKLVVRIVESDKDNIYGTDCVGCAMMCDDLENVVFNTQGYTVKADCWYLDGTGYVAPPCVRSKRADGKLIRYELVQAK